MMDKGKEHFEGIENEYEETIKRIVPCYVDFYGSVLSFIPERKDIRILELGSGTGFFTSMMLKKNSGAEIVCIDLSKGMLDVAGNKPDLKEVELIEGDFREVWKEGLFDVVVTTLCMHHIPKGDKDALLKKIYSSLKDDGIFINGDVFTGKDSFEEDLNMKWWHYAMINAGLNPSEAGSMVTKRKGNYGYIDMFHDFSKRCTGAGFKVVMPYKNRIYGVFGAFK
ncbi:cyclopropane fatty-acyl-phospholipid synthase-like methyltransferase [Methanomicrobium sp. W14]|uniref:class I SAM-dependent methyltransferase n=1 Tax=Methanomicrobium sp. W14 TaxID=2817839 RepID=UPI001AE4B305|nr:class I SAM-dependent methyltransferase [Methanomicrobium sp. W14]MBP2134372.1 cyclopropane fatty-acyl-phospholipid synthase-like methyltransferase [Methanomicrobium sp. W14]